MNSKSNLEMRNTSLNKSYPGKDPEAANKNKRIGIYRTNIDVAEDFTDVKKTESSKEMKEETKTKEEEEKERAEKDKKNKELNEHYHTNSKVRAIPLVCLLQVFHNVERNKRLYKLLFECINCIFLILMVWQVARMDVMYCTNAGLRDLFVKRGAPSGNNYNQNLIGTSSIAEIMQYLGQGTATKSTSTSCTTNSNSTVNNSSSNLNCTSSTVTSFSISNEGVFYTAVYKPNERTYKKNGYLTILDSLELFQPPQLKQVRSTINTTCRPGVTTLGGRTSRSMYCVDDISPTTISYNPYGPINSTTNKGMFIYEKTQFEGGYFTSGLEGWNGYDVKYGQGGFLINFTMTNPEVALQQIANISINNWIDDQTRALVLKMNLYNRNTGLLTTVQILFQIYPTGFVYPSYKINTFPYSLNQFLPLVRGDNGISFQFDERVIVPIIFTLLQLRIVAVEIFAYFPHLWNCLCQEKNYKLPNLSFHIRLYILFRNTFTSRILALAQIICIIVTLAFIYLFISHPAKLQLSGHVAGTPDPYVDLSDLAKTWTLLINCIAFNIFIYGMKVLHVMSLSKKMLIIVYSFGRAMYDILAFFVFVICYIGMFTFAGFVIFGPDLVAFHDMPASFSSLLQSVMGNYDYDSMENVRPEIAPFVTFGYVAFFLFIVNSTFVAILTKYYGIVSEEIEEEAKLVSVSVFEVGKIWFDIKMMLKLNCCSKNLKSHEINEFKTEFQIRDLVKKIQFESTYLGKFSFLEYIEEKYYKDNEIYQQKRKNDDESYKPLSLITINEFCGLLATCIDRNIDKNSCNHNECFARKIVDLYYKNKEELKLRFVEKEETFNLIHNSKQMRDCFQVTSVSDDGSRVGRFLYIDSEEKNLIFFSHLSKPLEVLKIEDIIQIETNNTVDDSGNYTDKLIDNTVCIVFPHQQLDFIFPETENTTEEINDFLKKIKEIKKSMKIINSSNYRKGST